MKTRYVSILLIVLVAVALTLSGCTSPVKKVSGSSEDQGTPTATPRSGASSSGSGSSLTTNSLFDNSNLKYYEWRWETKSKGKTDTFNYRVERGTESYNGAPTKFKKVTFTSNGEDPSKITLYYDSTGERAIAYKIGDQVVEITQDNEAMAHAFDSYDIGALWAGYNQPLSNSVPDTLIINGKTYVCQKYAISNFMSGATIWTATVSGKQLAVQVQYKDAKGDSMTYQLWDWG